MLWPPDYCKDGRASGRAIGWRRYSLLVHPEPSSSKLDTGGRADGLRRPSPVPPLARPSVIDVSCGGEVRARLESGGEVASHSVRALYGGSGRPTRTRAVRAAP